MLKSLLITGTLLLSSSAFAAGDAGCGLGSMIFKSNGKLTQLFAVTTNGSFGSQTLGITSGTSGCSASSLVKNDQQIQYFVEVNQEDLTREMAQGHGEKLMTLAVLNGCTQEAQAELFASKVQGSYSEIVPSAKASASEIVHNLKASSAAKACVGS